MESYTNKRRARVNKIHNFFGKNTNKIPPNFTRKRTNAAKNSKFKTQKSAKKEARDWRVS